MMLQIHGAYSASGSSPNSLRRTDEDGGWKLDGANLAYVAASYQSHQKFGEILAAQEGR
jgi:hypothetical protein